MNNSFEKEAEGVAGDAEGAAHSSGQTMQEVVPRKRSKWIWILPIGCLGVLLCCGGGIFGLGYWGYNLAYNNDGYNTAINTIQESSEVQDLVGTPVMIQRNMNIKTESSGTTTRFIYNDSLSGPKGSGVAEIVVTMDDGTQEFTTDSIKVTVDGETVDITDEGDFTLDIDDLGE